MTSRVLVVSPRFHGYDQAVARAFEELGFQAQTFQYDAARHGLEKAWRKVRHELPAKLRGRSGHLSPAVVTARAAAAVRAALPDVVLVIRGDVLGEEFWEAATAGGRPVAVWMYDEMRRTDFDAELVRQYARIATYSVHDTAMLRGQGIDAVHVPLGFNHLQKLVPADSAESLVSFIGAEFPRRLEALVHLHQAGVPVRAWGRGWSDHPLDRARTWRLHSRPVPNGRDVSGPEALGIMRASAATLNIHGDQDGFTMRTFEAAGVGGVQLVDRADVDEFYEPGSEVLVYESLDELVELARHATQHPGDFAELRRCGRKRTLAEHTLVHRAADLRRLW